MTWDCRRSSSRGESSAGVPPRQGEPHVIYESHLRATEENAWPLDTSIAWDAIDLDVARTERDLHQALHDAALIEGYLPVYAARLMQLLWDDVDATAVLSMELYEGLKHFTALTRYLDRVGYQREEVSEATLVAARARALGDRIRQGASSSRTSRTSCARSSSPRTSSCGSPGARTSRSCESC